MHTYEYQTKTRRTLRTELKMKVNIANLPTAASVYVPDK